jgi:hypothetical protein
LEARNFDMHQLGMQHAFPVGFVTEEAATQQATTSPQQPDGWLVLLPHPFAAQVQTPWFPAAEQIQEHDMTTLCIRSIPNNYTTQMVLDMLNSNGLKSTYDFFYLPHDFKRLPKHANVGYFFVNFVSHDVAVQAWMKLEGFNTWPMSSKKILSVSWATNTQGLNACIERYHNSPVIHRNIPSECKPMLFRDGEAIALTPIGDRVRQPRKKIAYGYQGQLDFSVAETITASKTLDDEDVSTCPGRGSEDGDGPETDRSLTLNSSSGGSEAEAEREAVVLHHAVWMPDRATDACLKCTKQFSFLRRKHHCRVCGLIFCAECAPRTSNRVHGGDSTHKRVCRVCAGGVRSACASTEALEQASPKQAPPKPSGKTLDLLPGESTFQIKNTFVTIPRSPSLERLVHRPVTSFPL